MAKGMCISGIVIAALIALVFLVDLLLSLSEGTKAWAPFRGANQMIDIVFVVSAAILGYLSWSTLKEQV